MGVRQRVSGGGDLEVADGDVPAGVVEAEPVEQTYPGIAVGVQFVCATSVKMNPSTSSVRMRP